MISANHVISNNGLDVDDNIQAIYQLLDQLKQIQDISCYASKNEGQTVTGNSVYSDIVLNNATSNFASKGLSIDSNGIIHVDRLINSKLRIEFNGQIAFNSSNVGKTYFIQPYFAYGEEDTFYAQAVYRVNLTCPVDTYYEQPFTYTINLDIPSGVTRVKLMNTTNSTSDITIYRSTLKVEAYQSHLQ